ncbi:hypothetical protein [Peribacillus sp. TH27]|uniref:hypothetical protein n=1 Tax=Peribacillus sp. TH27 TaxID=2798484 RepID=UPI00191136B4|nr:hypothetical protein [Peribacillus sp. TH27]MBK5458160.1 hypothetical protein [Peribacillus sp. TH27]
MGFKTVDLRNALIGKTPGSEKISKDEPVFLLNLDELTELKAPYMDEEKTETCFRNISRTTGGIIVSEIPRLPSRTNPPQK